MTIHFRYTDGSTGTSISGAGPFPGGSPFATGTSITRPTTRQGIFDEINTALTTAGWTSYVKTASQDIVYESDGESTDENIGIQMEFQTTNRYLVFYIAPKLDSSDDLEARIGDGAVSDANNRWDLGAADFTSDMFVLASKDSLFAMVQNINHTSSVFWVHIGVGARTGVMNPNVMALNAGATTGTYVNLDVTPASPAGLGYRVGESVTIVETAKASSAKAHKVLITGIGANSIEVRNLPATYAAGALVGANASPLFRAVAANELPTDTTAWRSPFYLSDQDPDGADVLAVNRSAANGQALVIEFTAFNAYATNGEFGAGNTKNARTNRFTCRTITLKSSTLESLLCKVPSLIAFPGNVTLYPHDVMLADRVTPNKHFVGFRPTSSTAERWMVGPTS